MLQLEQSAGPSGLVHVYRVRSGGAHLASAVKVLALPFPKPLAVVRTPAARQRVEVDPLRRSSLGDGSNPFAG